MWLRTEPCVYTAQLNRVVCVSRAAVAAFLDFRDSGARTRGLTGDNNPTATNSSTHFETSQGRQYEACIRRSVTYTSSEFWSTTSDGIDHRDEPLNIGEGDHPPRRLFTREERSKIQCNTLFQVQKVLAQLHGM